MKIIYTCLLAVALFSCTKVITPKLDSDAGTLDIEANVTDLDTVQEIFLRTNVSFSATNRYPSVSHATVTATDDDGNRYTFTEAQPGAYKSPDFSGVPGRTYTLQFKWAPNNMSPPLPCRHWSGWIRSRIKTGR